MALPAFRSPSLRIAHLSDVHILEERPHSVFSGYGLGVGFLSIGRRLHARERVRKLSRSLHAARRNGAQHFILSGDLTEIGSAGEYETLAETLHDSGIDPDRFTLVPGNHDAYTSPQGWRRAMEGPLRPFRRASATHAGKVVETGGIAIMPVDVACHQAITRSAGELTRETADAMESRMLDPALRSKPLVVVQHHPPFSHKVRAWQWVDGLQGWARGMALLKRFAHSYVLHGHLHHPVDRLIEKGRARVFGAPAIVEDAVESTRFRLYEVFENRLESIGLVVA